MGEWTYIGESNSTGVPGTSFPFDYTKYTKVSLISMGDHNRFVQQSTYGIDIIFDKVQFMTDYDGYVVFAYFSGSSNLFAQASFNKTKSVVYLRVASPYKALLYAR